MAIQVNIIAAESEHEAEWRSLWGLYWGNAVSPEVTDETWRRLVDQASAMRCIFARCDSEIVGFLHYVVHASTSEIKQVCYVEDVYVAKKYRGPMLDIAYHLVAHIVGRLKAGEWSHAYGITRARNRLAQKLYDRFAAGEPWIRYLVRESSVE